MRVAGGAPLHAGFAYPIARVGGRPEGLWGCQKMSAATEPQWLGQHPSSPPPSSVLASETMRYVTVGLFFCSGFSAMSSDEERGVGRLEVHY
ncbi:hypothetical protein EVAR_100119_1 [Eumeta japonica]|uniref:Uncharacterized protein n=1 Tax=Eumeta variegata TaxID=151549 RepID=A0A4C2AA28_EUMVA|nr:hypothetical protein EVAR_100119_1 [Eumeta japonica]